MDHSEYREALDAYKQEHLPVVLTAAEAMDILGVGKNTMYRLLKSGELPAVRIGKAWRINLEHLHAFLAYH
ncbi:MULTISPECIES: helix-turn-helix domain-containing protein [Oscillospiraceae]|uniref:helix-turn-helix domain-containing protein n=1 Tax=Oscillospiraceae TaxID=216572 RepID=UPI0009FB188C|nr:MULTISPECIES: helix-turn-helix domain-containing protein [unclassified Oscillibacter]